MPEADLQRCRAFGTEMRCRFGASLAETSGTGDELRLRLPRPQRVDHVVLIEEIDRGERVREYCVEGLVPRDAWQVLCIGQSIGHKRTEHFTTAEVAELRVTQPTGTPRLHRFAASCVST